MNPGYPSMVAASARLICLQENGFPENPSPAWPELHRIDGQVCINNLPINLDKRVRNAIDLLLTEPARHRRLPDLAKSVGLSASRLCHLFQTNLQTSAAQYLKAVRLCLAAELLDTTDLLVKQVVGETGLGNERQFARDFRKAFGLPPREYRNRPVRSEKNKT